MQQLLIVALVVILVGVAIVVGIAMLGTNAYNSNRSALSSELQYFGSLVLQYWKMPEMMGGAGMNTSVVTESAVSSILGFAVNSDGVFMLSNDNGEYRIKRARSNVVVLVALGKEKKEDNHPYVETTIQLETGTINTVVSDAPTFPQ
ncbi:MAG: hypothetical protein FJ042_08285 [Candidatus Cloacimonetes bacterium]|nr:hypothetical protein [Candidatus Cloacimonadota bacterium]